MFIFTPYKKIAVQEDKDFIVNSVNKKQSA